MIAKFVIVGAVGALALAVPASARSPHPLAPPDPGAERLAVALKHDARGQPLYCYRFTPPAKLVARELCRTRQGWSAWGVDVDRQ
ncbi:MAG: hypothetical protein K2X73_07425 [Sphingomonas sp.]|uniref:hypothetical protein n=1 Tax=Sphingomonas sp. TaxID=28214 RepID=UPI0025CDD485|nr:hypothetical protein [Sphingomonas sp.]MBX9881788.1 hypothetical protein [Sphingomonas sp.]